MTKPRNRRSRILCLGLLVQLTPALRTGMCRMVVDFQRKHRLLPRKRHLPLRERQQEYGLVYIVYIRFALRAEGVDASRAVFWKARKNKWTTWEVFESAALMEYHVAKQFGVANKIFGLAHSRFPDEVDFVVRSDVLDISE
ncbi:hypothetical protein DFH11DRAFT_1628762 [Phellopilus nigrolimitatus]|nr:hypothetical protein DFH11DRAFT_1628762 [Phellopilus nigrolimitatus]